MLKNKRSEKTETSRLINEIEKKFGKGTLKAANNMPTVEYRSSGSLVLDMALGGGWGKATIVDVIGKQSAGKTLLFEMAAVAAQRIENRPSCIFDFEGAFEPKRFEALGGDLNQLYIVNASNFEEDIPMFVEWAADMLKVQLRSGMFACIALDSTAGMVSRREYETKEEEGEEAIVVGKTAYAITSLLRQIVGTGLVRRSDTTLFFISQMRANFLGRSFKGLPPADNRTGCRALPHFASTQVEVSRGDTYKGDVETNGVVEKASEYGHETKVRVRKNKLNSKQGRVAAFDLYTEGEIVGLDTTAELIKMAILVKVIEQTGAWYVLPGGAKLHGANAVHATLVESPPLMKTIESLTRAALEARQEQSALPPEVVSAVDEDEETIARMIEREKQST